MYRSKLKWRNVVEGIGLVAVVASLLFVGVQLRQDHVIARSELGSGTFELMLGTSQSLNDAEFAAIYAKMLQSPDKLTVQEMIRINAFLTEITDLMNRDCYLVQRGVFVECDDLSLTMIKRYFGNAYAQAWWRLSDTQPGIELSDWVDDAVKNTDSGMELERIKAIQNEVSADK